MNLKRKAFAPGIAVPAACTVLAQEKKEPDKKAASPPGILHPEVRVVTGTLDNPAATLGTKPGQPWITMGQIVTVNGYNAIFVQGLSR